MNAKDNNMICADRQIFDRDQALEVVDGDLELFREIATMFFETLPHNLDQIRQAAERQDAEALEGAAHSLKGAAASLATPRCRDAAYALEIIGKEGDFAQAATAIAKLQAELKSMKTALQVVLSESNR
jgi:HPt (histidine-containing phosphotransfer) domain-containing protein